MGWALSDRRKRAGVVHHMLGERHDGKHDFRLGAHLGGAGVVEQRQRHFLRQRPHLPQGLTAVEAKGAEGVRRRQLLQARAADPAPPPQIAHVAKISLLPEVR